ncbi:MAG TPA: DUF4351 domain-containing protein [Bryobacteraceae bacterium]|jgi:hypothetical protein|nr:DUF4351 domain-containing protein [Bryobacteraceae bacterium]
MKHDVALKALLQASGLTILERLAGARFVRWLNVEIPQFKMPRLDLLAETDLGELVHFELQSLNDTDMPLRMAEYALAICRQFGRFPRQFVLYVGAAPLQMAAELQGRDFHFAYTVVDIRELDSQELLNSDAPGDNILAVLANTKSPEVTALEVLRRLSRLPIEEQAKQLPILMILSGLRGLGKLIQSEVQQMPITVDVDEIFGDLIAERVNRSAQAALDKGMREGIEKGREQGALSLLHRQIATRFGPLPEWAEKRLNSLSVGQLEDISIRVLNATSLDQLFAQQ